LNQHIYNIRIQSEEMKRFTFHWLQFILPSLRSEIEGGAGQLHLTKSKIEDIGIPQPPPTELTEVLGRIEALTDQIANEKAMLRKRKKLKSGLMQDLLTGKVRVNVE